MSHPSALETPTPALPPRQQTRRIQLGRVPIGGGAPVSVQTMANTDTRDVGATVGCIREAMQAGCDIVRLAVPDAEAAAALAEIRRRVEGVPLVADIHFDWRLALQSLEAGVDGLRINPGNIGGGERVRAVAAAAKARGVPIRIGVNAGSIEPHLLDKYGAATAEALVESAMAHVALLEAEDFYDIKISVKASDIPRTLAAYRLLATRTRYPLHLGLTEAGTFLAGTVRSSVAMGILLDEGLGDTIRVSLTDSPVKEVAAGQELLRCLGLREPGANVTSCPTCGRTEADVVGTALKVEAALERLYRERPDMARPRVAVMGCVVNGPGEARDADIALVGGKGFFLLYVRGVRQSRHDEGEAVEALLEAVRRFA
ncbi:MAG: flavodoxin-dependent (E)-4-hydroxy-3-methylbut-2-enyl-diphosphate synthase [Kiritimatiellia bacterium]